MITPVLMIIEPRIIHLKSFVANWAFTLYVPDYKREFVLRPDKQSRFIESVLLGVPLTPFLVSEDKDYIDVQKNSWIQTSEVFE
jgi:hypothetical protein